MGSRGKILIQLYNVLENNSSEARIYYWLADKCKHSSFKYFFKKLSLQKRLFCRRIRYEIKELEKEIEFIGENLVYQNVGKTQKSIKEVPSINRDVAGLAMYCYKREQQNLEFYTTLLSQTNLGSIREMLLSQKHYIQLILNEIKNMDAKNLNVKNEGEINYR